jgi:2-polyprenyl-3-methyl-5-hydroxy-6-metoxy-1,4-benzoquinol methylase
VHESVYTCPDSKDSGEDVMNWWHTIELPDGTVTPGKVDYRGAKGDRFLLPKDLTGKTVLDLGTYDGFWAIEAKKRGAMYVLAADRWMPMIETAELSLKAHGIEYSCCGNLDQELYPYAGFDIVLFYGILYHLRNPYQGLQNAADCCKPGGIVIVESAINQGKAARLPADVPALWIIDELHHGDDTNYVMPNYTGIIQLAKMAGLVPEGEPAYEPEQPYTRVTQVFRKPIL